MNDLSVEVFVVDNASIDGSNEMLRTDFKDVQLIANDQNVGFAVANNQAIKQASGKYVLVLNPDTVLEEDTLQKCFDFMESNSEVGALGVKMIDGAGKFLPESKRALPTVWNSFTKLSGLAALFPNSSFFNGYALGHLDENQNHQIEVLCGAFMFVRKTTIDKVGMFDERFFMYGEDIDWSRRILEGGFHIHYLSDTAIIHYKGESTKKASLSYVKTFYSAMSLYVEKHYTGKKGKWFAQLLKMAISIRAFISGAKRVMSFLLWPIFDAIVIALGLKGFSFLWASFYFKNSAYYNESFLDLNIVFYALIWSFILWFIGYYQKATWRKRLSGVISGLMVILTLYALLPDGYRSSRVIILAGTLISFIASSLTYLLFGRQRSQNHTKKILIVAKHDVAAEIKQSLSKAKALSEVLGIVNPDMVASDDNRYLNDISQLGALSKVMKADEVIFSSESLSMKEIMKQMMILDTSLSVKIAGDDSLSIIGSDSKNTSGEFYSLNIKYNLSEGYYQHLKRMIDVTMGVLVLFFSPFLLFMNNFKVSPFYKNIFQTIFGFKTFIGYAGSIEHYQNLPQLNPGVVTLPLVEKEEAHLKNMYYARDYVVWTDLEILLKNLNNLT